MLVVDFQAPVGCAPMRVSMPRRASGAGQDRGALLGRGHLAMTIDQGPEMSRYQGLVALDGGSLEDAAHEYFLRSEQIPTRVRLAVAEELRARRGRPRIAGAPAACCCSFCPRAPERMRGPDLDPGDAPEGMARHTLPRTTPGSKASR